MLGKLLVQHRTQEQGSRIAAATHLNYEFAMYTKELKKNFGKDLTFYGGGVDTQHVLPHGTPQEVRDEVKHRIDDLAPGGGFIFNTVHNIQADVPPENIVAMWEAMREYGVYRK
jgi:uroporphyrinogen decarboxylase